MAASEESAVNTRSQMGKGGLDKDAIYCGVTDGY